MRIKKTTETRALAGTVVNTYSESQTSAYSCDYMNWKTLAEGVDGGTATALPSNFNELSIYVYQDIYWGHTIHLTEKELISTDRDFLYGAYLLSSSYTGGILRARRSQITTAELWINGSKSNTIKYSVYYR